MTPIHNNNFPPLVRESLHSPANRRPYVPQSSPVCAAPKRPLYTDEIFRQIVWCVIALTPVVIIASSTVFSLIGLAVFVLHPTIACIAILATTGIGFLLLRLSFIFGEANRWKAQVLANLNPTYPEATTVSKPILSTSHMPDMSLAAREARAYILFSASAAHVTFGPVQLQLTQKLLDIYPDGGYFICSSYGNNQYLLLPAVYVADGFFAPCPEINGLLFQYDTQDGTAKVLGHFCPSLGICNGVILPGGYTGANLAWGKADKSLAVKAGLRVGLGGCFGIYGSTQDNGLITDTQKDNIIQNKGKIYKLPDEPDDISKFPIHAIHVTKTVTDGVTCYGGISGVLQRFGSVLFKLRNFFRRSHFRDEKIELKTFATAAFASHLLGDDKNPLQRWGLPVWRILRNQEAVPLYVGDINDATSTFKITHLVRYIVYAIPNIIYAIRNFFVGKSATDTTQNPDLKPEEERIYTIYQHMLQLDSLGPVGGFLGRTRNTINKWTIQEKNTGSSMEVEITVEKDDAKTWFGVMPGFLAVDKATQSPKKIIRNFSFTNGQNKDYCDFIKHVRKNADSQEAIDTIVLTTYSQLFLQSKSSSNSTVTRSGFGIRQVTLWSEFWEWIMPSGFSFGLLADSAEIETQGTYEDVTKNEPAVSQKSYVKVMCDRKMGPRGDYTQTLEYHDNGVDPIVVGIRYKHSRATPKMLQETVFASIKKLFDKTYTIQGGSDMPADSDVFAGLVFKRQEAPKDLLANIKKPGDAYFTELCKNSKKDFFCTSDSAAYKKPTVFQNDIHRKYRYRGVRTTDGVANIRRRFRDIKDACIEIIAIKQKAMFDPCLLAVDRANTIKTCDDAIQALLELLKPDNGQNCDDIKKMFPKPWFSMHKLGLWHRWGLSGRSETIFNYYACQSHQDHGLSILFA